MALLYHPKPGTIFICDYRGFEVPEMVKSRPVVLISPRLRKRDSLCTVVPLSTTAPEPIMPYHHEITLERPLPRPWGAKSMWAKCDMLATVGFGRLDLIKLGKDGQGKRKYITPMISDGDLEAVRKGVLAALGI